jgi:hypothetical protein
MSNYMKVYIKGRGVYDKNQEKCAILSLKTYRGLKSMMRNPDFFDETVTILPNRKEVIFYDMEAHAAPPILTGNNYTLKELKGNIGWVVDKLGWFKPLKGSITVLEISEDNSRRQKTIKAD